jgi:hypothetical protein
MTTTTIQKAQPNDISRSGGLAGIGGAVALFAAFTTYPIFDLPSVDEIQSLTDYPELATGRILENSLYLAALVLWAVHFVAIGRSARSATGKPSLAPVAGVVGLSVMAAGALIHVTTAELSDRYIDAAGSAGDQADIVLAWDTVQILFNALLVTGVAIVPVAMAALGWSLMRTQVIGRLSGVVALSLGVVASIGGAAGVIAGPSSPGVAIAVLVMVIFHALVGWRMVRS